MKSDEDRRLGRAAFVDRDGTLNDMVYDPVHGLMDSPRRTDQVRMKAGAGQFISGLKQLGYRVVVVTNQPAVAKETLSLDDLASVNARLQQLLKADGDSWDNICICTHHPRGNEVSRNPHVRDCECRKPKPGLLQNAARELGLDLASSWMIGDGLNDIEAGHAAGCRTILVTRLKLEQVEMFFSLEHCRPDAIAVSLADALAIIRARSETT